MLPQGARTGLRVPRRLMPSARWQRHRGGDAPGEATGEDVTLKQGAHDFEPKFIDPRAAWGGLPPGWSSAWCPEGRAYYYAANALQWERPLLPAPGWPSPPPIPADDLRPDDDGGGTGGQRMGPCGGATGREAFAPLAARTDGGDDRAPERAPSLSAWQAVAVGSEWVALETVGPIVAGDQVTIGDSDDTVGNITRCLLSRGGVTVALAQLSS